MREQGGSSVKHNGDISAPIYHYSAFGIRIDSEILLPELSVVPETATADVIIRYGDLTNTDDSMCNYNDWKAGNFLFKVDDVPAFCIMNGKQIVVQPFQDSAAVLPELLGTVMGALLMQRNMLPVHGSMIIMNGFAIIFTGESGAGKSTTAAALRKRGYTLMSDDLSAMTCDCDGIFWGQPGYMQQRLGEDTTELLDIDTSGLEKVFEFRNKYVVPVSVDFDLKPIPIGAIYEIVKAPCEEIIIENLQGIEKLKTLMNNTYQPLLVSLFDAKEKHLKQCLQLSKQIPIFRLSRPEAKMSIDQQIEAIIQLCKNLGSPVKEG